jgi:hypothetical protein
MADVIVTPIATSTVTVSGTTVGPQGATGATGATGSSGVISVTAPITNSGTSTSAQLGFDQTAQNTTNDGRYARLASSNAFTVGGHTITNAVASVIPLQITAASSQSADLQQWRNSTPTTVAKIASDGHAVFGLVDTAGQVSINPDGAARIGIRMRLAASQSSDAIRIESSTPATLFQILASGIINYASANTSSSATAGAITAPALVTGFLTMQVAGTTVKVPYYSN